MKYLLDTNILIWWLKQRKGLPSKIRQIIKDPNNEKNISIVSLWEIIIKINIKKLDLDYNINEMIDDITESSIIILPIEARYLEIYTHLPLIHKDPFDRFLISTSIAEDIALITSDEIIHQYDIDWIW